MIIILIMMNSAVSLLSFNPFHDYCSLSISPENIRKEVFLMFSKDIGKDQ